MVSLVQCLALEKVLLLEEQVAPANLTCRLPQKERNHFLISVGRRERISILVQTVLVIKKIRSKKNY